MTPKLQQASIIGGFALLGILAVAGWTRNPSAPTAPTNYGTTQGVYPAGQVLPVGAQPTALDANGRMIYGQPYANGAAYAPGYGPGNCVEAAAVHTAAYAPEASASRYRTYSRPRVVRTYVDQDRDTVVRRNKRSTGKSVAIVAGSAGAGAAIGALAGGGKGAAIGGLTGGAAGFIYDRLTHNR
jgi:hypothetical protein